MKTWITVDVAAVGVWGNHGIGLCFDPTEIVPQRNSPAILDFMSSMNRGLHSDPKTAQRDQLIRTVIAVQSRDLNDPQAERQHLKTSLGRWEEGIWSWVVTSVL